jgi:hypothetical protein
MKLDPLVNTLSEFKANHFFRAHFFQNNIHLVTPLIEYYSILIDMIERRQLATLNFTPEAYKGLFYFPLYFPYMPLMRIIHTPPFLTSI